MALRVHWYCGVALKAESRTKRFIDYKGLGTLYHFTLSSAEVPLQIWILGLGLLFCYGWKLSGIRWSISLLLSRRLADPTGIQK